MTYYAKGDRPNPKERILPKEVAQALLWSQGRPRKQLGSLRKYSKVEQRVTAV